MSPFHLSSSTHSQQAFPSIVSLRHRSASDDDTLEFSSLQSSSGESRQILTPPSPSAVQTSAPPPLDLDSTKDLPPPLLSDNEAVIDLQGSGITASYAVGSEKDSNEERTSPQGEGPDYLHSSGASAEQHKGDESEDIGVLVEQDNTDPCGAQLEESDMTYGAS